MSRVTSFIVALGLATASAVPAAALTLPTSCQTALVGAGAAETYNWTIAADIGPCTTDCEEFLDEGNNLLCDAGGSCTGIQYTITTRPGSQRTVDKVSTLVLKDADVVHPTLAIAAACAGDAQTTQGKASC